METAQKTIVVSDIHMSTGSYSWFQDPYPGKFAAMLSNISDDPAVGELVFLGDLFDLWNYPVDVVPDTVDQILTAYSSIEQAIRQCVQKIPNVYYINGNHDITVTDNDLQRLGADAKTVQLITSDDYNCKHDNIRHLEHGHKVDMFNARDISADTIGGYPLGFFITRLLARAADQDAARQELRQILEDHGVKYRARTFEEIEIKFPSPGTLLVEAIVDALAIHAGVVDDTPIRFQEKRLDGKFTIGDIKTHYGSLLRTWWLRYPLRWPETMVVTLRPGGLDWYADRLLSAQNPPKIVVMGHTHHAMSMGAYDNDGCWCRDARNNLSYVQIVGDVASLVAWP